MQKVRIFIITAAILIGAVIGVAQTLQPAPVPMQAATPALVPDAKEQAEMAENIKELQELKVQNDEILKQQQAALDQQNMETRANIEQQNLMMNAQSNQVQARRDGNERNDLREEQDQARAGSTLVILTSVTFAPRVVLVVLTSSKRCLAGPAEAEVADLVAAVTLKLNSSCQSRKRTVAHGAQYRCRWLRPARPVAAAA